MNSPVAIKESASVVQTLPPGTPLINRPKTLPLLVAVKTQVGSSEGSEAFQLGNIVLAMSRSRRAGIFSE